MNEHYVIVKVKVHGVNRFNAASHVICRLKHLFLPVMVVFGSDFVIKVVGEILFKLFCRVEVLNE